MSINRKAIMTRAWEIFRATYRYPSIPFASIGRGCFAWALRKAWAEARDTARIAAIPAAVRAERVAALEGESELLTYADSFRYVTARRAQIAAELGRLAA